MSELRERRRAQILEGARDLVAVGGLEALTISKLEKRLTFSRGVITYHFANKDEILQALLRYAVTEIDRAAGADVRSATGAEGKIRAAVRGVVQGFVGNPAASIILMSFWGRLRSDPAAAEINAEMYRRYRGFARDIIESEGVTHGDVDAFATVFVGVIIGIACQTLFEPGAIDTDAAIEEASRALIAVL